MEITDNILKQYTPLAPIIWARDDLKEEIKKKKKIHWVSRLSEHLAKITLLEKEKKTDEIEKELIQLSAWCLVWIEKIRKEEEK